MHWPSAIYEAITYLDLRRCGRIGQSKAWQARCQDPIEIMSDKNSYDVEDRVTGLFMMYHRDDVAERYDEIIGNHHDYSTYYLYNWYKWKKEGKALPPIVVGTDDTGIFATNIYNEYCNIYCQFLYFKGENTNEIMTFLRELNTNARHYAFTTPEADDA